MKTELGPQTLNVGRALISFQDKHGTGFHPIPLVRGHMREELSTILDRHPTQIKDSYWLMGSVLLNKMGLVERTFATGVVSYKLVRLREKLQELDAQVAREAEIAKTAPVSPYGF